MLQLLYSLPQVDPPVYGSYFIMSSINSAIVRRTWGLLQTRDAAWTSYGNSFDYDEFMVLPNIAYSLLASLVLLVGAVALGFFSLVRVNTFRRTVHLLIKYVLGTVVLLIDVAAWHWTFSRVRIHLSLVLLSFHPQEHASRSAIGWYVGKNVTSSHSNPPRHVQTIMKIKVEPGYAGASSACNMLSFLSDVQV